MPRNIKSTDPVREGDRVYNRKDGTTYIRRRETIKHWELGHKWQQYWLFKRNGERGQRRRGRLQDNPAYHLTEQDEKELTRRFPEPGKHPSVNGWHLGRIDHELPYTLDNCRWEWYLDNLREMQKRIRHDSVIPIRCKEVFSYPLI